MRTQQRKHNLIQAGIQRLVLALVVAGGMWLMMPFGAHASTGEVPGEVPGDDETIACGTVIGEGEECGWPEFDPNDYDPVTGEPLHGDSNGNGNEAPAPGTPNETPDGTPNETVKCPIVIGEGVVCTGPTIPEDLPVPTPGGAGEPADGEQGAGGVELPPCAAPQGTGIVCSGPDPLPEPGEGPTQEGPTQEVPVEADPVADDEAEDAAGPRVESPASGQTVRMIQIFVPTLSR